VTLLQQMLSSYPVTTSEQADQALREVMQEIALAGLNRGGFFEHAAFYGGTCLRVFYELPRYSEDLDFSLLRVDPEFSLEPYFKAVREEFSALGIDVEVSTKIKSAASQIESAFVKNNTRIFDIHLQDKRQIKIKFEVDTQPPLGFVTEEKLLLQPFSFYVKCFSLQDLYAGKMHALLYRQWKNRVKGRDWYDFEWYVRRGVLLNLAHFTQRARQSGGLSEITLSEFDFKAMLRKKIESLDVSSAKKDIERFILDPRALDIWSQAYFLQLVEMIKFQ
jgi:predicted nucleotidyltransferase component of viral defense system